MPRPGTLLLLAHFMKLSLKNTKKFRENQKTGFCPKGVEESVLLLFKKRWGRGLKHIDLVKSFNNVLL